MLLTSREAAAELGVSVKRIHALIRAKRLKAQLFGPVYIIQKADLAAVKNRKPGRPKSKKKKAAKTIKDQS